MDSQALELIRQVLYKGDNLPYCFYGMYTRMGLALSMNGHVQVHIAKVNEAQNENGNKTYDNEGRLNFSLNFNECLHISNNIKGIINGTYVNPFSNDEKYKNSFSITHFPKTGNSKATSRLSIAPDEKSKGALKVTIFPPSDSNQKPLTAVLGHDPRKGIYESTIFLDFIKNVAKNGAYNDQHKMSVIKTLREMIRIQNDNSGGGGNKSTSGGKSSYTNKTTYNKPAPTRQEDAPPQNTSQPNMNSQEDEFDMFGEDDDEMPF
jgi:hypothetical protein